MPSTTREDSESSFEVAAAEKESEKKELKKIHTANKLEDTTL